MKLQERIRAFEVLFEQLQLTNSRNEKDFIVKKFTSIFPELNEDLNYILETLAGKHPIGWTFNRRDCESYPFYSTIKELIMACENSRDKTVATTSKIERDIGKYGFFIEPIVNRKLRLGIGNSLLSKTDITPMLAKKYEGGLLKSDVVITEKLDGNRCIAHYDGEKWCFTSRSGKPMNVNFDMTGMNTDYIYDGEVMSELQTDMSIKRYGAILRDEEFNFDTKEAQLMFNETSGLINRHGAKKGLVYNVFDIVCNKPYYVRRTELAKCEPFGNVRIVPLLYSGHNREQIQNLLYKVTQMGGEGIMLNLMDRNYEHKRTDALLKYKQVQTMDLEVISYYYGTGKYEGMLGGLNCKAVLEDGKCILVDVGTGITDDERMMWAMYPDKILGKIVEVAYHELTQEKKNLDTNVYSLRFPRLVKVRNDKSKPSEF